jgi:Tol biopolymer transport system component
MGRVYKARDTRLNRTVAIKICGEEFPGRFQREAQAIAALNHPFICTLHDVGPDYLVMEHVEGKPLQGPLPLDKVLEYGSQLCDALEAAHRKGIVHRDLKPSNVFLTRSGVKVLDFGLAKVAGQETVTQPGIVMGTPGYMAPEQWEGKEADARSDIYALGRLIYELATGDPKLHQTLTPAELDRAVKTCLERDPENRWQSVRELKLALELARPSRPGDQPDAPRERWDTSRSLAPWLVAGVAIVLAVAALVNSRSTGTTDTPAMSTVIPVPPEHQLVAGGTPVPFDVAPDGTKLVYLAMEAGRPQLFLRPLDAFDTKLLPGTDGASAPFFSPDGRWIGFFVGRRLFRVATDGGSPVFIGDVGQAGNGACWAEGDSIVYGSASGLMRISSAGGTPSRLTAADAGEAHILPRAIAGSPTLLFTIVRAGFRRHIAAVSLKGGTHRTLIEGQQAAYVPNKGLVYATDDVLRTVPFDLAALRPSGSPSTLLDDVYTGQANSQTYFNITRSGLLVYVPGRNEHSLTRVDRSGHATPFIERRAGYRLPSVSPDGRFVAVTIDPPDEGNSDVWVLDVQRGALSKLTRHGHNLSAKFTPDGTRIAWADWQEGPKVFWQPADGSGKPERLGGLEPSVPQDFSPDGKYAILAVGRSPAVLWALPLNQDSKPFPLTELTDGVPAARLSPDGRWLAYVSNESGRDEVYVRGFLSSERRWVVSTAGGILPVWSRDGKEIFYLEGRKMMSVSIQQAGAELSTGRPVFLFDRPELTMGYPAFDVLGNTFVMVQRDRLSMLTEFRVVQPQVKPRND